MEWEDLKRLKTDITSRAIRDLNEKEVELLSWLIAEERKFRFAARGGIRVPKALRDQIEAIVPDVELGDREEGV